MARQRFPFTLPSENDLSLLLDPDNIADDSYSPYSYLENLWPQTISPEPDVLMPYSFYQYPCFQIPSESMSYIPSFFYPPLSPDTINPFDDLSLWNNLNSVYNNCTNSDFCSNPAYGNAIISEDLPSCIETIASENFNVIRYMQPITYPIISHYGTVTILLRHLIRVDLSPNMAVYVTNPPASCIASINEVGDKSCVIHPNGRVHQIGENIHMVTLDYKAKICSRGVIFTSAKHCLSYIVDSSGTKTTSEKFVNLNNDFSLEVFYSAGVRGDDFEECYKMINEASYKSYKNGDEVWFIGDVRIKQDQTGDVKIIKNGNCKAAIRTSPTSGEVSVKTFLSEINVGRYHNKYFDVRKGDKEITSSLTKGFRVKNGSQRAGFNSTGKVVLL